MPEIIDEVYDIVLTDRVKVRELVEATGISHGTVISILHEQLGMEKLSTRWMPHLLTVNHKREPYDDFKINNVWRCFNVIASDDASIHYCGNMKHGSITSHPRQRNS